MAPKKMSGATDHPSTLKAPSHAATDVVRPTGAHGDMDAAGNMTGAGGTITIAPLAEAGAGGAEGGQHQQHPDGHAP